MTDDLHEPRARRYAEALAAAAAANERINALTDQLTDHEWARSQAESQVGYLRERLDLGGQQIITGTDDEPGAEIRGLIDLTTGRAWVRPTRHDGSDDPNYWISAAASERGQMRYEWPISDAGPFIALPDDYALAEINQKARQRDEREDRIRSRLRGMSGYPQTSAWSVPDIDEAVLAVVAHLEQRHARTYGELHEARNELDATRRELAAIKAEAEVTP